MERHNKPCAGCKAAELFEIADPWTSYRYKGNYGWIMIGAMDDTEALSEANRSLAFGNAVIDNLQVWSSDEGMYKDC